MTIKYKNISYSALIFLELGYSCRIQYKNLTDSWRKITGSSGSSSGRTYCDHDDDQFDGNTWFRFVEQAGTKVPTAPPSKYACKTSAVGWMEGAHPTSVGQIVSRKMCFCWDSTCQWSNTNTKVTACRDYDGQLFYLYQFKKPPSCSLAYCAV